MTFSAAKDAVSRTILDVDRHHTFQMAAALSYYFVSSLFPALILLSATLAFLPSAGLLGPFLGLMARFLPAETVMLVNQILLKVITSNRGALLSVGMLGTLWTVSSAFAAAMEALDIAYDVNDNRPFWKTRSIALGLALAVGAIFLVAMPIVIVGPRFGEWLAQHAHVQAPYAHLWPFLHWSLALVFAVLVVELLYYFAPFIQQRFLATLPGAVLTVTCWIGLSYLLGLYVRHFGTFNQTYGALGGAIMLMLWLYWTSFAMLVGAELNSELAKESEQGQLQPKAYPEDEDVDLAA
jgi:membrane protein